MIPLTFYIGKWKVQHDIIIFDHTKESFLIGNDIIRDRFILYGSRYIGAFLENGKISPDTEPTNEHKTEGTARKAHMVSDTKAFSLRMREAGLSGFDSLIDREC